MIALIKKRNNVNYLLDDTRLINIPRKKITVYIGPAKIASNPQPLAGIAYRATTNGASTFCFIVWVFKKKEIATRSVNKFVL